MPMKQVHLATPEAISMNFLYVPATIYMNSHAEQIVILMFLVCVDFVSGLMKSHRLSKRFTKNKFFIGVYMKLFTLLLPFLFVLTAKGVGYDLSDFIPFCLSVLIIMEFYSIIGNVYTLRTGKELEDKDILSYLLLKTRNQIDRELEKRTVIEEDK